MYGVFKKTLLLDVSQKASKAQSKTNTAFPFTADKRYDALLIEFAYAPKKSSDREDSLKQINGAMSVYAPPPYENRYGKAEDYIPLDNLLTVTLRSPNGFVGCAHRHANNQTHFIGKTRADYGFRKTDITVGGWEITLNAHCIVADCGYTIAVYGLTEAEK